ncbi:MAG: hypothetical protein R3190_10765, partial [Thermoanaerobaculia bacterium]|nr:hypothetical protein [Thermoanaerobaculia bacterium]
MTTAGRGRRWRRVALWAAVLLVTLPALVVVAARLALELAAVRSRIVAAADRALGEALGLELRIDDFDLVLRRGELRAVGIAVRTVNGDRDLLSIEELALDLRLRPLLARRLEIESVRVVRPVVDLAAPLPESTPESEPAEPGWVVAVLALAVVDGRILSPPPATADAWLRSWQVAGVDVEGAWLDDGWRAEVPAAVLTADLRETSPLTLDLSLSGSGSGTALELERLEAHGTGIDLSATVAGDLAADQPLAASFDLAASLSDLLPETAPGGRVAATGDLDLRRLAGTADIALEAVPLAIVEPWVARERLVELGIDASMIDARARVAAAASGAEPLRLGGTIDWRRGEEPILDGSVEVAADRDPDSSLPRIETLRGTAAVEARSFPVDLLARWLPVEDVDAVLAGTRLDLQAAATA